jgi:putative methionine-R-sulfoxide reductase with GAF domain
MAVTKENVFDSIRLIVSGAENRVEKARKITEEIRKFGPYRWVGLYDVGETEVSIIAYSGPSAPAYPTFPIGKGLTGTAIKEKKTVVVGDVTKDPRYLTAFGSTKSEIIIPIVDSHSGIVVGTIDVESERTNAFSDADRKALEDCAAAASSLWIAE